MKLIEIQLNKFAFQSIPFHAVSTVVGPGNVVFLDIKQIEK